MRRVMLLTLLGLVLPTAALANSIDLVNAGIAFRLQVGPSPPLTVVGFSGNSSACRTTASIQATTSCSTGNAFNGVNINNPTAHAPWVLNLLSPAGRILVNISMLRTSTGANCALNDTNPTGTCNFMGTVTAFGTTIPTPNHMFTDSISGTLTKGPSIHPPTGAAIWVLSTLDGELANHDGELSVDNIQLCQGTQVNIGCGDPGKEGRIRSGFGAATLLVVPEPGTLALLGTGVIGLAGMLRRKCKPGK